MQLLSSRRRIRDIPAPPLFECQTAQAEVTAGADKPLLAYMLATRQPFEDLRKVVTQIAALLILAASGSRDWRDHPMIELTAAGYRAVQDAIRAIVVPASASHVHGHLLNAECSVAEALSIIKTHRANFDDAALDAALQSIKAAQREMQWSSAAVPGLEMIAFSQGCCAAHRNQKLIEA